MTSLPTELSDRARAWLGADPDPATRAELERLLADDSPAVRADLADRFAGRLEFGTAGLRGVVGAGPNRMNRAVVRAATYGLGAWLKAQPGGLAQRGVVVGHDARIMSPELAADTCGVLLAMGIPVRRVAGEAPTPFVAFAAKELGAAAAVVVTASHNPPEYNGYKVYGPSASQIVPPVDVEVETLIQKAPPAKDIAVADLSAALATGLLADVPAEFADRYQAAVLALLGDAARASAGHRDLPIVYTPLHGVGGALTTRLLAAAGFAHVFPVAEQLAPDGRFPTVAFPNPEEKGAMDLAFALAKEKSAALVVANDPDADRLAVAVPGEKGYVQLTGNQVGVLLGAYLLERARSAGVPMAEALVITTVVSSPMLSVVAKAFGARYEETLTGFKWIAARALELEKSAGTRFLFGYEEALGYTVGTLVRDKDGISAATVFAQMTASLAAEGRTVLQKLDELAREHGLFVSAQVNVTKKGADGAEAIRGIMSRLRAAPPARFADAKVIAVRDYEAQKCVVLATGQTTALVLPPSNVLTFDLEGGHRIVARPSGTEPKIKFYFDVREPVAAGESLAAARARAEERLGALRDAFVASAGA